MCVASNTSRHSPEGHGRIGLIICAGEELGREVVKANDEAEVLASTQPWNQISSSYSSTVVNVARRFVDAIGCLSGASVLSRDGK